MAPCVKMLDTVGYLHVVWVSVYHGRAPARSDLRKTGGQGKMARKRAKKSGVLTLRIPPEVHRDVALTAADLGLDVSGLIRLMIRRSLPHFMLEARLIAFQAEEAMGQLETWQRNNPDR